MHQDGGVCSHYQAEKARQILEKRFGIKLPDNWEPPRGHVHVYPTQLAPIVRRPFAHDSGDDAVDRLEIVGAHFGLLPSFAKELRYGVRTYNARTETVNELPSFRQAWIKAQHCIVPATAFYEPDWRSGRAVPTRFSLADEEPMGLAGLWNEWRSPEGERVLSFCMLTINADDHPLMKHMHRPDPELPPDRQDKRMVVVLPRSQFDEWLDAPAEAAMPFMRAYPADRLVALAEEPEARPDPQGSLDF